MKIRTGLIILGLAIVMGVVGVGLGLNDWHKRAKYLETHFAGQRDKQRAVAFAEPLVTIDGTLHVGDMTTGFYSVGADSVTIIKFPEEPE